MSGSVKKRSGRFFAGDKEAVSSGDEQPAIKKLRMDAAKNEDVMKLNEFIFGKDAASGETLLFADKSKKQSKSSESGSGSESGRNSNRDPFADSSDDSSDDDAPAWVDADDKRIKVDLSQSNMLKKLREGHNMNEVDGEEYQRRLREQFVKMNGTAAWTEEGKNEALASSSSSSSDSDDDDVSSSDDDKLMTAARQRLLRNATSLVSSSKTAKIGQKLPASQVDIRRFNDLNLLAPGRKEVLALNFHPKIDSQALVLTRDRCVREFKVNNKGESTMARSTTWQDLALRHAAYSPDGDRMFCVADHTVTIGVMETTTGETWSLPSLAGHARDKPFMKVVSGPSPHLSSCQSAKLVCFMATDGSLYLWDDRARSVAQHLRVSGAPVAASFGATQHDWLATVDKDCYVSLWDLRRSNVSRGAASCLVRRNFAAAVAPASLACSNEQLAVGSASGVVSIFDLRDPQLLKNEPAHEISNLTTVTDSLAFHPSGEMLALASSQENDFLRLSHCESQTVFQNWPTQRTPLKKVTQLAFSPQGQWLAIGNSRGEVKLERLEHYHSQIVALKTNSGVNHFSAVAF